MERPTKLIWIAVFAAVAIGTGQLTGETYYAHVAVLGLIYMAAAVAWNISGGYAGQVSFGHAVFFGAGGYVAVVLSRDHELSPWVSMVLAAAVCAVIALPIGAVMLRLNGHYFSIGTLVLAETARLVVGQTKALGGAGGLIVPLGRESWWNMQFGSSKMPFILIATGIIVAELLLVRVLMRGRFGYRLTAARLAPETAKASGVNVLRYQTAAWVLSASLTGVVGVVYAQYLMFLSPDSMFDALLSVSFALMVMLGGKATFWGPIIGGATYIALNEGLRTVAGADVIGLNRLLFGGCVVFITLVEPGGLLAAGRRLVRMVRTRREHAHPDTAHPSTPALTTGGGPSVDAALTPAAVDGP